MSKYTSASLEALAARLDVDQVLEDIHYRLETIQRSADRIKCFCPIHGETVLRSLTIEVGRRRYKCGYSLCKGSRGGNLLRLWALARGVEEWQAGEYWARRLQLPLELDPEWEPEGAKPAPSATPPAPESSPGPAEKPVERAAVVLLPPADEETPAADRTPAPPAAKSAEGRAGKLVIKGGRTTPAAPPEPSPAPESDVLVRARQELTAGRAQAAAQLLDEHLAKHPDDLAALLLSAGLRVQKNDRQGAADLLERALRERRAALSGRELLTLSYKLHELEPESAAALDAMAEIYQERGEAPAAIEKWYQAADLWHRRGDRAAAMARLTRVLELRGDESKALEALAKLHLLEKQPDQARAALLSVARVYMEKDLLGQAGDACQRALALAPDAVETMLCLAEILHRRGMEAEAAAALLRAADTHAAAGRSEPAVQLLYAALEKHPEQSGLRERLAEILRAAGSRDAAAAEYAHLAEHFHRRDLLGKAIEAIRQATALHPESGALRERFLELLLEKGDTAEALEELTRWGAAAEAAGDFEAALACLERMAPLAPGNQELSIRHCRLLVSAGQAPLGYDRLLEYWRDAEERQDSAFAGALLALQQHYWPDRPLPAAKTPTPPPEVHAETPAPEPPSTVEALCARAETARQEGRLDEAAECLETARAMQPESRTVLSALAETRRILGESEAAFSLFLELARLARADPDEATAVAHLTAALQLRPDEEGLRLQLCERLVEAGRTDEALDLLVDAPGTPALRARRLEIYRLTSESERAGAELPQALEELCEAGQADRALALYRETLAWTPLPWPITRAFAELLYLGDRSGAAVEILLAAARQAADQDDRATAAEAYRKALEIEEANPRLWQAYLAFLSADAAALPERRRSTLALAGVYRARDQAPRALRLLDEAGRADPDCLEYLFLRIELETEEGSPERAAALCLEAAARLPEPQSKRGRELLLRAARLAPENPEVWLALFQHHAHDANRAPQLEALERLIELWERKGLVGKCVALLEETRAELTGKPEEMALARRLAGLFEAKGDGRAAAREYLRLAELAAPADGVEAALDWIRKGLERDPDSLRLRLAEARLLARILPLEHALRRFHALAARLAQKSVRDPLEDSVLDEALADLLALCPDDVEGTLLLARRKLEADDRQGARRAFRAACQAAEEAGQWEAALAAAEALRRLDPDDPELLARLAELYQQRGETARALACRDLRLQALLAAWRARPGAKRRNAVLAESRLMLELEPLSESARRARLEVLQAGKDSSALVAELLALLEIQAGAGRYREQLETYRRILELTPDDLPLRHRFAVLLEGLGELGEAVREYLELAGRLAPAEPEAALAHYRRVLQLEPDNATARQALGETEADEPAADPLREAEAAAAAGRPDEAERICRSLLETEPDHVAARRQLIALYVSQGNAPAAVREISELCRRFDETGRLLETVDLLRQATLVAPDRWDLRAALGDRYQRFGNFASAEAEYRQALQLLPADHAAERRELHRQWVSVTPGDATSLRALERCLSEGELAAGELEEAESVRTELLRMLSLEPASRRALLEAEQLAARIRPESRYSPEAQRILAGIALRVSPAHAGTHRVYLAVRHFLADRPAEALEEALAALALPQLASVDLAIACQLMLRLGPGEAHRSAARRLAGKLLASAHTDEGLGLLRELLEIYPDQLALRAEWIAALSAAGDLAAAREAKLELSGRYLELGERVEAIRWCRAALSLDPEEFNRVWEESAGGATPPKSPFLPEDAPVLLRLAEIYRAGSRSHEEARVFRLLSAHCAESGQSEPAVAYARRVLALLPDDAGAHAQLAELFEATGDLASALEARLDLARLFLARELPEKALGIYRAALERAPDAAEVREELAGVLSELGRGEESSAELLAIVDRLCAAGRQAEALERLLRFTAGDPGNAALGEALARLYQSLGREAEAVRQHLALGDLHRQAERTRKAQEHYERALELDPACPDGLARLAGVLSDRGRDRQAAEAWLKLARLRSRQGDGPAALQALNEALEAVPEHPAAVDLLITTLEAEAAAGRPVDAGRLAAASLSRARRELSARLYRQALDWVRKARLACPEHDEAAALEEEIHRALSREEPQEHLEVRQERLLALLGQGDLAGAVALLERLLLDYPERVELARQLAQIYRETGRGAEATALLVQQGRRLLQSGAGEPGVALELLREAYHHEPENPAVGEALLSALLGQGEREAARALVAELGQRAAGDLPQPPSASAYQAAGRWWKRGLELWPEWEPAYEALIDLARRAGRNDDALARLEELARLQEKEKRAEDALRSWKRQISLLPEPRPEELTTQPDRAQQKARRRIAAQQGLADFLLRLGRPEEAAETLMPAAHLAARCELTAAANQLYARVLELSREEQMLFAALEGQAKLHTAAGNHGEAARVLWSMVPLYERAADSEAVGRACRRVLELEPSHRPARERLFALLAGERGPERLECGLALGRLYRESDLYGKAEEVYRQLLEAYPGDDASPAPAYAPLAALYLDKGQEERLIQLCLGLAEKAAGRGHFRRQVEYYRAVLKLREDDLEARRRLPGACCAASDFEQALGERVNLAILYLRQNQPAAALDTIRDILRQDPDHSVMLELLDVLAGEEAQRGPVLDAVKAQLREWMESSPAAARSLLTFAERWAALDASLPPLLAAAWAAAGDRAAAVRWGLAWAESVGGEKGDAAALGPLRTLLEWDPQNPDLVERIRQVENAVSEERGKARQRSMLQAALLLFAEERWSEAADGFAELLALSPDDAELKLRLAQCLARLAAAGPCEERERAAALFLELAEREEHLGNPARARQHLESAVGLRPDSLAVRQAQVDFLCRRAEPGPASRALAELGALCLERGKEERALAAYRAALELTPDHLELLASTAELLARREEKGEARELYLALAERELAGHRVSAAIAAFQRALALAPDDTDLLGRLAETYAVKGENGAALALRRRRIALFREQGRRDDLLAEYRRLSRLDEDNAQLLVEWSQALAEAGHPQEARETLLLAARKYRERELLGKAAELYRRLFAEHPDDLEAGSALARCLADMGQAEAAAEALLAVADHHQARGDLECAEAALTRALESDPRSRRARRALADLRLRGQDTPGAIYWLLQLALLHRESGSPDRAAQVYTEILEHDPDQLEACRSLLRCLEETGEEKLRLATLERLGEILARNGEPEAALQQFLAVADHYLTAAEG